MAEKSRALHHNPSDLSCRKMESAVDTLAATAFGITDSEFQIFTGYYEFTRPPEASILLNEDEIEE